MAKRKWLGITLAATLLATVLTACGSGGKNEASSNSPSAGQPASSSAASAAPSESAAPNYGDTGGLQLPLVDKPTTINWMLVGENPVNDKMIVREIEKRTGIKVNFMTTPRHSKTSCASRWAPASCRTSFTA